MTFNPEMWVETTIRTLKAYAETFFNTNVWEVVMEFPGPQLDLRELPLDKTIIHFEVDSIDSAAVGMGDGIFADNYDPVDSSLNPQYASMHRINFDVGVWATDASGGTTSRMRARQILQNALGLPQGIDQLRDFSDADDGVIEIMNFSGGNFALDRIGDVTLYRMVDCQLEVRVFSRTPISQATGTAIEEIDQAPNLTITQ